MLPSAFSRSRTTLPGTGVASVISRCHPHRSLDTLVDERRRHLSEADGRGRAGRWRRDRNLYRQRGAQGGAGAADRQGAAPGSSRRIGGNSKREGDCPRLSGGDGGEGERLRGHEAGQRLADVNRDILKREVAGERHVPSGRRAGREADVDGVRRPGERRLDDGHGERVGHRIPKEPEEEQEEPAFTRCTHRVGRHLREVLVPVVVIGFRFGPSARLEAGGHSESDRSDGGFVESGPQRVDVVVGHGVARAAVVAQPARDVHRPAPLIEPQQDHASLLEPGVGDARRDRHDRRRPDHDA